LTFIVPVKFVNACLKLCTS